MTIGPNPAPALDARERAVYAAAHRLTRRQQRPSLEEIARAAGVHASTVMRHLRVLAEKGWVAREPRRWRALRCLRPVPRPRTAPKF